MNRLLPMVWLAACKAVDPIPEDADGALHWLWSNLDDAEAADLASGVVALDAALDGASLTEATDGSISRLTVEQVEPLGVTRDPSLAAAIFLANRIDCDPTTVSEIFTHPDQDLLYPGIYERYVRTYAGERDAWLAGETDTLAWSLDYAASVLGSSYDGHTEALLRRVRPEGEAPFREAHLVRFFAPEAAVFEGDSNKSFEQDYQFEVYWSREDGETLHAYGMWRQANWGLGFTSEEEGVQRILLNNMAKWDDDTEKICADGGP
jgi:hypothetical protein